MEGTMDGSLSRCRTVISCRCRMSEVRREMYGSGYSLVDKIQ